jgi:hypothetical protein
MRMSTNGIYCVTEFGRLYLERFLDFAFCGNAFQMDIEIKQFQVLSKTTNIVQPKYGRKL